MGTCRTENSTKRLRHRWRGNNSNLREVDRYALTPHTSPVLDPLTQQTSAPGPEILLQKQFRPPLDKTVIEIPAGLIDAGETVEQAAVRELKEETGYVGTVTESSPVMFNGRGHSFP